MVSTQRFLVALFAVCGLGLVQTPSVDAADAKVTGKITVAGKPLEAGKVTFHFNNGQFVGSSVKDGDYTIDRIPAGGYKITVEGKGVPAAATSADTTGLVVEIKEGKVTFDINLPAK